MFSLYFRNSYVFVLNYEITWFPLNNVGLVVLHAMFVFVEGASNFKVRTENHFQLEHASSASEPSEAGA
jgi:hypothetical protein